MARTKAEIRAFLDSMVGGVPQHPAPYNTGVNNLSGQCVTGIKVLLEFLGVPNPYAARGNATDVDDALLSQGIADNGKGWLTIVVNHDMGFIGGVHYGHIWADLQGEANYETNGNWALHTTKNTRPISQGQQFVNLDKWVSEEDMKFTKEQEQTAAIMATGSVPGDNYNYPFTVEDITSEQLDKFLQTWTTRMTRISKDMENAVADGVSGVKNYIGWDNYNSQFVGQPVISHYPEMVKFWIAQKPAPKPDTGNATILKPGNYKVQ